MARKIRCCKCGCGQKIIIKPYYKYRGIPDYIQGHNGKRKNLSEEWNKIKDIKKYCKCGCGNKIIIKPYHKWYGIPNYIINHCSKTKKLPYIEKYCECGCNTLLPNANKGQRYFKNHGGGGIAKGTRFTKEHRKKQSIAQLKYIEENNYTKKWARTGKIEPIFEETVLKKIKNLKYEKQKPINKIGIVDFFLPDYGIIIECDEKHHKRPKQKSKDTGRDFDAMFIFKYKYDTIRFTDTEIENNPKNCIREIKKCIRKKGT